MPEAKRQPGKAVCDDCRVDPRKRRTDDERQRRLRKYGLTQDEYDRMLADQAGRCRGCGSDDPGPRGWNIDHCHETGRVRCLLCLRCNTILGLADEDADVLRQLAQLAQEFRENLRHPALEE
jgi:hypothetical protein